MAANKVPASFQARGVVRVVTKNYHPVLRYEIPMETRVEAWFRKGREHFPPEIRRRGYFMGRVVSTKNRRTLSVWVTHKHTDARTGLSWRRGTKLMAHDSDEEARDGDLVLLKHSGAPRSKKKHFDLVGIVEPARYFAADPHHRDLQRASDAREAEARADLARLQNEDKLSDDDMISIARGLASDEVQRLEAVREAARKAAGGRPTFPAELDGDRVRPPVNTRIRDGFVA